MTYKKQLKYNPDDFNEAELQHFFDYEYQDRGMLKWQGFFLSDHTSALNKESEEKKPLGRPKQSETEISEHLIQAWQSKRQVTIQLEEVDDDQVPQEVSGKIAGYHENEIVVQSLDSEKNVMVLLDSVRNIRDGK